jgi:hypothetical protein
MLVLGLVQQLAVTIVDNIPRENGMNHHYLLE